MDISAIFDSLSGWIEKYNTLMGNNGFLAATLAGGLMYALSWIFERLCATVNWLFRFSVIQLTLQYDGDQSNQVNYAIFLRWVQPKLLSAFSRIATVRTKKRDWYADEDSEPGQRFLSVSQGLHFFFYEKRLFWIFLSINDTLATETNKEAINVYSFGFDTSVFKRMVMEVFPVKVDEGKLKVFSMSTGIGKDEIGDDIWSSKEYPPRLLDSVAIPDATRKQLESSMERFLSMREWYTRNGIPYKLGICFYGPPGTGKSSISRAIAHHLKRNLYCINLSEVSNLAFTALLRNIPPKSVVLFEDVDTNTNLHCRTYGHKENDKKVGLGTVLNGIDGAEVLDDLVLIFNTNAYEVLDPAFRRAGRFDLPLYIGNLNAELVKKRMLYCYGEEALTIDLPEGFEINGSELQRIINENPMDAESAILRLTT
jgi:chaperone BCS1